VSCATKPPQHSPPQIHTPQPQNPNPNPKPQTQTTPRDALSDQIERLEWAIAHGSEASPGQYQQRQEERRAQLELLRVRRAEVKGKHSVMLRDYHEAFHHVWGRLLKTGYQNSRYAHQVGGCGGVRGVVLESIVGWGGEDWGKGAGGAFLCSRYKRAYAVSLKLASIKMDQSTFTPHRRWTGLRASTPAT